MTIVIDSNERQSIIFEEFLAQLDKRLDPTCHESMVAASDNLKALANNRTFLSDIITLEIKNFSDSQNNNTYVPPVVMLDANPEKNYFVRANLWPSTSDQILKSSGDEAFSFNAPHDHNFNFLTVGYFGPGYWSDYYEYESVDVIGYPGEKVKLNFVERSALSLGKIMLYRAGLDVHSQLPPDSFSISLNIMERTARQLVQNQYYFDVKSGRIQSIVSPNSFICLLTLASAAGGPNSLDLLDHVIKKHPNPRVRFGALKALSSGLSSAGEKSRTMEAGISDSSDFVREATRLELTRLESTWNS